MSYCDDKKCDIITFVVMEILYISQCLKIIQLKVILNYPVHKICLLWNNLILKITEFAYQINNDSLSNKTYDMVW